MYKAYFNNLTILALLYNYEATHEEELPCSQIENYILEVNFILLGNNSNCSCNDCHLQLDTLYYQTKNEDGVACFKIKPEINITEEKHKHITLQPLEVIVASQMDEPLKQIGLMRSQTDGKMMKTNDQHTSNKMPKSKKMNNKLN